MPKVKKTIPQNYQKAYVWFDVALKACGDKENAIKKERDEIGCQLDSQALKEAKKQSDEMFGSIVFSFRVGAE